MSTPTPRTYAAKIKSGFAAIPDGFYDHARGLETELNAATTERDQLRAEVERLKTCGITELAAVNPSVADYCKHWEARAERAEAELAKYLSACPASPTEEERKRCQQWWAISGRSP